MNLKIKSWSQCFWASKSQYEQKLIVIKTISGISTGVISIGIVASSLDFDVLYSILLKQYIPIALAAMKANQMKLIGGLFATATSIYLLYQSLISAISRNQDWIYNKLPLDNFTNNNLIESYHSSGYTIDRPGPSGKGLVTFSSKVNFALRTIDRLPFNSRNPWKLRGMGRELLPFGIFFASSKGIAFDSVKVRLGTDLLFKDGKLPECLVVQQTRYFSGLATNDLSYLELTTRPAEDLRCPFRLLYDGKAMFLESSLGQPPKLGPLEGSSCSNHVGVSTMAITQDRVIIVTGQSTNNIQSRKLLAPSGSGSIDWRDLKNKDDYLEVIRAAAERELIEECGLKRSPKLLKTSVTGFARLIHRGGKPEFFCLTIINANSGDIDLSHSREEKYFTDFNHLNNIYGNIDLSPVKIVSSVKDFCNNNKEKISVPLELSLRFMADAIEENASTLFNTGEVH